MLMKNRVICLILTVLFAITITSCRNNDLTSTSSNTSNLENISSEVFADNTTSSKPEVVKENINKEVYQKQETVKEEKVGIKMPLSVENGALRIDSFIKYSGLFMEDLSFAQTSNALAARVVNTSGKYIDVAIIQFSLSDGTEASFWLSRLAPGETCDVQEKSNMKFKNGVTYTLKDVTIKYMDNPTELWDISIGEYLSFQCTTDDDGNNIAVVINRSEKTVKDIKVWYKRKIDGIFIGGYTYILNVSEQILPGEQKFIPAQYFNTECVIIDSEYTVS